MANTFSASPPSYWLLSRSPDWIVSPRGGGERGGKKSGTNYYHSQLSFSLSLVLSSATLAPFRAVMEPAL